MPASKLDAEPAPLPFDTIPSPAEDAPPDDETQDETKAERQFQFRFDAEHLAALERLMHHERLSRNDVIRRLIRLADQAILGDKSPFRSIDMAFSSSIRRAG